jgi:hypothetical protein
MVVKTGLFSSVVATFLSISYYDLIPDSANTTNALLAQISQQLVDISNGVSSQNDATFSSEPFTPSATAIRVNVIWFLSLVLSIASALNATLFQQWSRRYLEITRRRVAPHKRARTRAYMFNGIASFKMSRAVKAMPMLLHLSIFLFFIGLIDYLWNANSTVGRWVLGFISVLAFAYLTLTVLPNVYLNCPYSTPLSKLSWRLSQRLLLFILHLIQGSEGFLLRNRTQEPSWWCQWREAVKTQITERRKWLKLGLQKSILLNATKAPSTTDEDALSWTLTVLDDDREFEDFVAQVPGFFESASVKNPSSVMLSLMTDQPPQPSQPDQFDPVLGSCINDLLKTCVPGTSPLKEELRRNRLRVCMKALWYFAREYNRPGNTTPLPSYARTVFASSEMTRRVQSEEDLAARRIGRSFSSLVVQKLARDIGSPSRTAQGHQEELSCLAVILGKTTGEVETLLSLGAIGLANIVSLASSEMDTLVEGRVPSEVLDIFQKTLDILLAEVLLALPNAELPPDLPVVTIFHETYFNAQQLQAPNWLIDRLGQISEVLLSVARDEPERLPETDTELGPSIHTSNLSLPSREGSTLPLLGTIV